MASSTGTTGIATSIFYLTVVLLPGRVQAQAPPSPAFPVSVLASAATTCAVLWTQPLCWGAGGLYVLGTGKNANVGMNPGDMAALTAFSFKADAGTLIHIRSARTYACATFDSGRATCWGATWVNQCGLSGFPDPAFGSPRTIPGDGQYVNGDPKTDERRARLLTTTEGDSCVLTWAGTISCFGQESCVLGRGNIQRQQVFDAVPIIFKNTALAVFLTSGENHHICALFSNSKLRCWGHNQYGQIGGGHSRLEVGSQPSDMSYLDYISFAESSDVLSVSCGEYHSCAIFRTMDVRCWGKGENGRLGLAGGSIRDVGLNATDMSSLPIILFAEPTLKVDQIATGKDHTCALFRNGRVRCFGAGLYGNLGIDSTLDVGVGPDGVSSLGFISFSDSELCKQVSAGSSYSCAVFSNFRIRCWGLNDNGQLGYDSATNLGALPGQMGALPYITLYPLVLTSLSPGAGSTLGGDLISLIGGGFFPNNTYVVRFFGPTDGSCPEITIDTTVVSPTSPTHIVLFTPAWACSPGPILVSIRLNGTNSTSPVPFVYYDPSFRATSFGSLFSHGGQIKGGSNVSLTGERFIATPDAVCRFSNNYIVLKTTTLQVTSEASAFCSSPEYPSSSAFPFSAENWDFAVEISLNGINFTSGSGLVYHYYHVTRLELDVKSGPASGATPFMLKVTADGNFTFALPHVSVYFNSSVCGGSFNQPVSGILINDASSPSGFSVRSASVRLETQKLSLPANFSLTVSFNNGSQYSIQDATFKYYFDPLVIRFNPPGAPLGASGDVNITIMGSNFADPAPSSSCARMALPNGTTLDHLPSTYAHPNLLLTLPPVGEANAGRTVIEVSFNGGVNYTSSNQSIYLFMLMQVDPSGGPLRGGTLVTITGRGFDQSLPFNCRFTNSSPPTQAVFRTNTTLECLSSPSTSLSDIESKVAVTIDDGRYFSYSDGDSSRWLFYADPVVTDLSPSAGPSIDNPSNTTFVNLTGAFAILPTSSPKCRFAAEVSSATVVSPTLVRCPLTKGFGLTPVSLALNGVDYFDLPKQFWFSFFQVLFISPQLGPAAGNTPVTVTGVGFGNQSSWFCRFSYAGVGVSVGAKYEGSATITCASPQSVVAPGTTVAFQLTGDGATFSEAKTFLYYTTPRVTALSPSSGSSKGTLTHVTVLGSNFAQVGSTAACKFGAAVSPAAEMLTTTSIHCAIPTGVMRGGFFVEISLNRGIDYTNDSVTFSFFTVDSITPLSGPASGGVAVTVIGSGFTDGAVLCKFGALESKPGSFATFLSVTCYSPAMAVADNEMSELSISTNGGIDFSNPKIFTIYASINATSLSPTCGPQSGGTVITVGGFFPSFQEGAHFPRCFFGDSSSSPATPISRVAVSCPSGNNLLDKSLVRVTFNGVVDILTTSASLFFYFFKVTGTTLPSSGPTTGGTVVALSGVGFDPHSSFWCYFTRGAEQPLIVGASDVHQDRLVCTIPDHLPQAMAAGNYSLNVTTDNRTFSTTTPFIFYEAPHISAIVPTALNASGGTFTVFGTNFDAASVWVRIVFPSPSVCNCTWRLPTEVLECSSPPTTTASNATVQVSNNGQQYSDDIPPVVMEYKFCPPGFYSKGSTGVCEPCKPGTYSRDADSRSCTHCGIGLYQPSSMQANCTSCPANTVTFPDGASHLSACVCAPGFYNLETNATGRGGLSCSPCPPSGECSGGVNAPVPRKGYWGNLTDKSVDFQQCPNPDACPGGAYEACSSSYAGRFCTGCTLGNFELHRHVCAKCPQGARVLFAAVFLFTFLIALFLVMIGGGKRAKAFKGTLGVTTKYFQVLFIIGKLGIFPREVEKVLTVLAAFFDLHFNIFAPDCVIPMRFEQRMAITLLLPLYFAALFAVIYAGKLALIQLRRRRRHPIPPQAQTALLNSIINGYISFLSLAYITLASAALRPFGCTGGALGSDPSVLCGTMRWRRLLPPAGLAVAVYVLGLPLCLLWWLRRNRERLTSLAFTDRFGSLYAAYVPTLPMWEVVVMGEKALIAAASILLPSPSNVIIEVVLLLAIFVATSAIYERFRPFVREDDNRLHSVLRWCSMTVLLAGLAYYSISKDGSKSARTVAEVVVWAAMGVSTLVVLVATVANLRGIHRSQKATSKLHEDFAAALDTLSAQGRAVVTAWLQHESSWRRPMYLVLADLQEREGVRAESESRSASFTSNGPVELPLVSKQTPLLPSPHRDLDLVSDAVVSVFCSGVFRDEVVPQVRLRLLKDGVGGSAEVGDFAACFTALAKWSALEHARDPQLSPTARLTRAALRHLTTPSSSRDGGQQNSAAATLLRSLYGSVLPPLDHAPLSSAEWLISLHAYYLATVAQASLPLSARCHPQHDDFEMVE